MLLVLGLCLALSGTIRAADVAKPVTKWLAGVARVDITPTFPVRLSGYAVRTTESAEVTQRIFGKALALGASRANAALLVTVENCGLSTELVEELCARLARRANVSRDRIAVCSTHTHSAPCLTGVIPNLFVQDIAPEEQKRIDRYTRELLDRLETVSLQALDSLQPAELDWISSSASFAANRRTAGGPVDHTLPILRVRGSDGATRAIVANYACHCTTLQGSLNAVCGDWAGFAAEFIERDLRGAVALVTIGCGADSNPNPRGTLDLARRHGEEIATQVRRLHGRTWNSIDGPMACRLERIELPFAPLPSRDEWQRRAGEAGIVGYHARKQLQLLERGEILPTTLPYSVQMWNFGNELALVFLPGEVVVDYALRLKREFDGARLWVTGYANGVPCYIPSRRILAEGGYEAETSLWYYDRPARLSPAIEDQIVASASRLLPPEFRPDHPAIEFPPPRSPEESLKSFHLRRNFQIDLVAAEPLIEDPVAIDFGLDGCLWVIEMHDYPSGLDGNGKPGGRVKLLRDRNQDGRFDQVATFLDSLSFPTGILAWSNGVLVCAAPDILYAEDTNGDDRADVVRKLYTGFPTHNFQGRVNSLTLGLDNWIHGASGLFGGKIRGVDLINGAAHPHRGGEIDTSGRDFRFDPNTGNFEPVAGLSQQGRVRNDWGDWFGCDNSTLLWHFPLPDQHVRRNPHVTTPNPRVFLPDYPESNRVYPASRTLARFNDPDHANHVTSACGLGIYRDRLLGPEFQGNAFVCEPVHNLVHRLMLREKGVTFSARRAAEEQECEFLASRDNWFRPVQAITGPDGALWIVDMYRFVIEHPRWISSNRLAKLDVRAGADKGRIYRVFPKAARLAAIPSLSQLSTADLVKSLAHPNGTERDRVHRELLRRHEPNAVSHLRQLFPTATNPACQVQILSVLDAHDGLTSELLVQTVSHTQPEVRRTAIRLSERWLSKDSAIRDAVFARIDDPEPRPRFQLAQSLADVNDVRTPDALHSLLLTDGTYGWLRRPVALPLRVTDGSETWIRSAALISSRPHSLGLIRRWTQPASPALPAREEILTDLIRTAIATATLEEIETVATSLAPVGSGVAEGWRLQSLADFLDALERRRLDWSAPTYRARPSWAWIPHSLDEARRIADDTAAPNTQRLAAMRLLGRDAGRMPDDLRQLSYFLSPRNPPDLHSAAIASLARFKGDEVPEYLISILPELLPQARSQALAALLQRTEWASILLRAVEKGTLPTAYVSAVQRRSLVEHRDPGLRGRAKALFRPPDGDTAKQQASLQAALGELRGNAVAGDASFQQLCAACHQFRGKGFPVGPDLASLTDTTPQYLLSALIDPNDSVEDKFVSYTVALKDGRTLDGIITVETATEVSLISAGGQKAKFLREEISELRSSGVSYMPTGLVAGLSPQTLADLIEFLRQRQ